MPTYEYICGKCEHRFDLFQSIKDQPISTCPQEKCGMKRWGKGKVKRAISAGAGLIFKGSGFYITDYRSENYKAGAKKDSGAGGGGESKGGSSETKSTGGESKPASGGESKPAAPKSDTNASGSSGSKPGKSSS